MTLTGGTAYVRAETLPALTGIRFFAAFAVLISHFTHLQIVDVPSFVIAALDGGKTAVSLFFVLSGFILAFTYGRLTHGGRRNYYVKRVSRIYPVVLLALGLGAVGVVFALVHPEYLLKWYSLDGNVVPLLAASFLSQLTMTTGWLPAASLNQPWNGPAWSISCEVLFYVLFPFFIVYARRLSARGWAVLLVAAFASQVAIIIGSRTFAPIGQRGFLVSQFPLTHMFEFIIGVGAGLLFLNGGREWLSRGVRRTALLAVSGLGIIVLSVLRPFDPVFLPLTPLFAVLIFTLAAAPARRRSWLSHPGLILLGEASFSLYMIHIPLAYLFTLLSPPPVVGWLLLVATIGISVGSFKFYETPARRWIQRKYLRQDPDMNPAIPSTSNAGGGL